MPLNQPVRRIAIVGTGVIGASWAAYYLSRGFDVVATDPGPQSEANLHKYVDEAWPLLSEVGLAPGASRDRLAFTTDMNRALADADWVQENAPERPDFKIKLFAELDEATPPNSIIASSSSGITMDGPRRELSSCRVAEAASGGGYMNGRNHSLRSGT
jgi:3-hydroxyacyl-CoA dehydrogenase